jgi:prepilin-type N-terminal cleavage/methylation domain-containing protein
MNTDRFLKDKGQAGFTLIEVLIALAIFSIGILAVAAMQINAANSNTAAGKTTGNITWASDRVEGLLGQNYDASDLDATVPFVAPPSAADGIDNDRDGTIDEAGETGPVSIQWTVTRDTAVRDTKTVVLTVTRTDSNPQKSVAVTQIVPEII